MASAPAAAKLSVIIPAYNEESYLPATLDSVNAAAARLAPGISVEVLVVDNESDDGTAAIALAKGARVIHEPMRGVAHARNAGARNAGADILVFIDADVIAPPDLLNEIYVVMNEPGCVGGAVDVEYRPQRLSMKLYLQAWRLLARLTGMAQGPTQFCRRDVFDAVGGYDPQVWIGEDVDFYWRLKGFAKAKQGAVSFIQGPRVRPSCRRFDKWPVWKVLVWTNPLFIALFRRRRRFWGAWHSRPVR